MQCRFTAHRLENKLKMKSLFIVFERCVQIQEIMAQILFYEHYVFFIVKLNVEK
jgi:hypothetical protein